MVRDEFADLFARAAAKDGADAVADAILQLAKAQDRTATQLNRLGLADDATPLGALEMVALELKGIGPALSEIADAVRWVTLHRVHSPLG